MRVLDRPCRREEAWQAIDSCIPSDGSFQRHLGLNMLRPPVDGVGGSGLSGTLGTRVAA